MSQRVLFVTSEIYPYVKTGGLGDVAGSLPLALKERGMDVRLFVPGYRAILRNLHNFTVLKAFPQFFGQDDARLLVGSLSNGMTAYVLDCPSFFNRPGLYVDTDGKDWQDNHLRFAAFCRAAADVYLYDGAWQPDVVHGNDWQTGLIPAYLAPRSRRPGTTITIHNLAYQGIFPAEVFPSLDLSPDAFSINGVEFYGQVSFLKAGLFYANKLTTVSPTYAREIQSPEFGCGLDGLLRGRAQDLTGILNGIDHDVWNPMTDRHLERNYNSSKLPQKALNKQALLAELGLPPGDGPLFAVVGRLTPQKGFDLVLQAAPQLLAQDARLVLLGQGDPDIEDDLRALEKAYPQQVRAIIGYEEAFEHRLHSAADAIIMPSRFEPCGLVQMYGLRYGAVPIVRRMGGLADTVVDAGAGAFNQSATGLTFDDATPDGLQSGLGRTLSLFRRRNVWRKLQRNAMAQDFGWGRAASDYQGMYARVAA